MSFGTNITDGRTWRYAFFHGAGLDESAITADTASPKPTHNPQPYENPAFAASRNFHEDALRLLATPAPMPRHAGNQRAGQSFNNNQQPPASSDLSQEFERPAKRRRGAGPDDGVGDNKHWACPFFKNNPDSNDSCLRIGLKRIVDVRQHINRHHMPIRCPKCRAMFGSKNEKDAHVRQRQCKKADGDASNEMNEGDWDKIAMRGQAERGKNAEERRWYKIWEILFPQDPHPESPYIGQEFDERLERAHTTFYSAGLFKSLVDRCPQEARGDLEILLPIAIKVFVAHAQRQNTVAVPTAIAQSESRQLPQSPSTTAPGGPQSNPGGFALSPQLGGTTPSQYSPFHFHFPAGYPPAMATQFPVPNVPQEQDYDPGQGQFQALSDHADFSGGVLPIYFSGGHNGQSAFGPSH